MTTRAARASLRPRADARVFRTARGLVIGAVAGGGAQASHVVAGGAMSVGAGVLVTVIAVVAGIGLARWRCSLPAALVLAGGVQGASHLVMAGPSAGHHAAAAHPTAGTVGNGGSMVLAHLVVVVATALVCRGADRAFLELARVVVGLILPRSWWAAASCPIDRPSYVGDPALLPVAARHSSPANRRGPPAPVLVPLTP
jgi:hypothetical protein